MAAPPEMGALAGEQQKPEENPLRYQTMALGKALAQVARKRWCIWFSSTIKANASIGCNCGKPHCRPVCESECGRETGAPEAAPQ